MKRPGQQAFLMPCPACSWGPNSPPRWFLSIFSAVCLCLPPPPLCGEGSGMVMGKGPELVKPVPAGACAHRDSQQPHTCPVLMSLTFRAGSPGTGDLDQNWAHEQKPWNLLLFAFDNLLQTGSLPPAKHPLGAGHQGQSGAQLEDCGGAAPAEAHGVGSGRPPSSVGLP